MPRVSTKLAKLGGFSLASGETVEIPEKFKLENASSAYWTAYGSNGAISMDVHAATDSFGPQLQIWVKVVAKPERVKELETKITPLLPHGMGFNRWVFTPGGNTNVWYSRVLHPTAEQAQKLFRDINVAGLEILDILA